MQRRLLKSKIHRARVTDKNLAYEGSISIDETLMRAADLVGFEQVEIYNLNNGARFGTYVIPAPAGSCQITINGAAARLAEKDDLIIIASYGMYQPEEVEKHSPLVVLVDQRNRPVTAPALHPAAG